MKRETKRGIMLEEMIAHAPLQYLTDKQGQRTAVVIDIDSWHELLEALEDAEDAEEMGRVRDEQDELISWQQVVAEYRAEHPDAEV